MPGWFAPRLILGTENACLTQQALNKYGSNEYIRSLFCFAVSRGRLSKDEEQTASVCSADGKEGLPSVREWAFSTLRQAIGAGRQPFSQCSSRDWTCLERFSFLEINLHF